MPEALHSSPARPAVVLGLTFLLVGLTFALPFSLVPSSEASRLSGQFSPEIANVYACVAWAGWAHFLFAFRGQGNALARMRDDLRSRRIAAYAACVGITVASLLGLRWLGGPALFGAVVWVYFIDHFLKAERSFEGKTGNQPPWSRWRSSYQVLLTFAWLSVVLLNVGGIDSHPWILWGISVALGVAVLALGGWQDLAAGRARGPLLALFFVGEALVWGTFSRYGGPMFLTGVYVFHIAAGSYFHYLGSYFVANARSGGRDALLHPITILLANLAIVGLGSAVARWDALRWLYPILGIPWFSLWVGMHLVTSDVFPVIKRRIA